MIVDKYNLNHRFFRLASLNILANVTLPLAGVALASILFDYLYWTFGFLRMSTTGTTAQAIGRNQAEEAYLTLHRSIVLAIVIALAILVLQFPLREVGFFLLGGTSEIEQAGRSYFNIRIWGAPAVLCNYAFLGWYLGREESGYALFLAMLANVSNILLDYIFIFRLDLAAFGAGLATVLSQYIMLSAALAIYFLLHRRVPWQWSALIQRDQLSRLLRLNRDLLVRTLCLISAFAFFTNFSASLGTKILVANTILLRILALASYIIDGVAFATESLAGSFRGQRQEIALQHLVRLSLVTGEAFALLFACGLLLFSDRIYSLITSHQDVIELTRFFGWWLLPVLFFAALAYIYDGLFLGLTAGKQLRNTMLLSTLTIFVPFSFAGLWMADNHLLWFAMVAFMGARAATLVLEYLRMTAKGLFH